jgi:glycosyltransferase involved in cell wall biosynthesis
MMALITDFIASGAEVTFMTAASDSIHKVDLASLGVHVQPVSLNCSSFDEQISALMPDLVVFDRYMTEEQFSWRVKTQCPDALRILNTEDLHSLRQARHDAVKATGDAQHAEKMSLLAQREIAAILRSDLTLIISRAEYTLLTDFYHVPSQQLFYFPLRAGTPLRSAPAFSQRKGIVTIGNFRHAPNWDAVLQLKQTIWPAIRKVLPDTSLHVYGAYPPKKATQLHNPKQGFYVEGWANDAFDVIKHAKLLIAPLRFGAGIKGKLLDAMRCSTPTLTTWIGAEGILSVDESQEHWGGAICASPDDYATHAHRLCTDETQWKTASNKGAEVLLAFGKSAHAQTLNTHLGRLLANVATHRQSLFLQAMLWHHTLSATKYMSQWI